MTDNRPTPKALNIALWIVQAILSISFIWAFYMKLFSSEAELAKMWPWTAENQILVRVTGVLDGLAGLGLVLPWFLNILPKLTIYTAYATIVLMIVAILFHVSRGESSQIGINIFFAISAIFIIWGRQRER